MARATKGFFRNAVDALIEARMRQARAHVNSALRTLNEDALKAHGYTRDDLKRLGR